MEKISWKGGALLAPVPPVLVSCGSMEHPNLLTVGWTGITNTIPPKTYISLRPERYSYGLIKNSGVFVINLTTVDLVRAADFCGVRSGRDFDKFQETGLTALPAPETGCPMLAESPLSLECRVTQTIPLGSHEMFLADIVAVQVDPALIDQAGKLHLERCGLAAYAHGEYFALGKKLGTFGFSVRKKPLPKGHKPEGGKIDSPKEQALQATAVNQQKPAGKKKHFSEPEHFPARTGDASKSSKHGNSRGNSSSNDGFPKGNTHSREARTTSQPHNDKATSSQQAVLKRTKPTKPRGRVPDWVPTNNHRKKKTR
ncbi:MAG: flavin reductase family protein [Oscillospiraceae bacterium]